MFTLFCLFIALEPATFEPRRMSVATVRLFGVIGTIFFGGGVLLGCLNVARPNRLIVDDVGVHVRSIYGSSTLRWEDVSTFTAVSLPGGSKAIGYQLKQRTAHRGFDGYLPGDFPGGSIAVEQMLTERRRARAKG